MNRILSILGLAPIQTDAREELMALRYGLTIKEYCEKVWVDLRKARKDQYARSRSWPRTSYDRKLKGYVLASSLPTKVMSLDAKRRSKAKSE